MRINSNDTIILKLNFIVDICYINNKYCIICPY